MRCWDAKWEKQCGLLSAGPAGWLVGWPSMRSRQDDFRAFAQYTMAATSTNGLLCGCMRLREPPILGPII